MLYTQLIDIDNPLRLSKPANEGQQGITVVSNCTRASFVHIMKRDIVIKCNLKRGTLITRLLITISKFFTHRTPPTSNLKSNNKQQREIVRFVLARPHSFFYNKSTIREENTMAIQKQVTTLRQGTDKWNSWREKHPDEKIDLIGANLNKADLNGADLNGADLSGANLNRANLSRANLSRAHLNGAHLSGAH